MRWPEQVQKIPYTTHYQNKHFNLVAVLIAQTFEVMLFIKTNGRTLLSSQPPVFS